MSTDTPEFEPGREDEITDEPLDGRDSQPVTEGSSDDPRTLDAADPLRDAESLIVEGSGHEARAEGEEIPAVDETDINGTP